eukprot:9458905-Pyramimonas_sp.AAC.1
MVRIVNASSLLRSWQERQGLVISGSWRRPAAQALHQQVGQQSAARGELVRRAGVLRRYRVRSSGGRCKGFE